jgi:acyl-CoA synthetase (AMP-forming)/AMP-acid ligase II
MTIYEEVLGFIQTPEPQSFEPLALRVFRHQFAKVAPYREYCLAQGVLPDTIASIDQIPALSTDAFKYADISDSVTPRSDAARVFMTSGTTAGRDQRGSHRVPRLEIYRASAVGHLRKMFFPDKARMRMLSLHPTAERMPESSLGQMISWIVEEFGAGDAFCAADSHTVKIEPAIEFLRQRDTRGEAVCVMGTTAAFARLFDELRARRVRLALAPGSRLMDTGGAKGQAVPLAPARFVENAADLMGIEPEFVVNEYGMTEMCSQLYDATPFNSAQNDPPDDRRKLGPPWLQVTAVDPATLKRVPEGSCGLLRMFDLANVGSVSALLTGDMGLVEGGAVKVIGRAVGADARGCALSIEQFAAAERSARG